MKNLEVFVLSALILATSLSMVSCASHPLRENGRKISSVNEAIEPNAIPESVSLEPLEGDGTDEVHPALHCGTRIGLNYEFCPVDNHLETRDSNEIIGFRIKNNIGGNAVVQETRSTDDLDWPGPFRSFEYRFQNRIRRDIELHVTDAPSENGSDQRDLLMLLFPRKLIPSVQVTETQEGMNLEVTLPTGEKVVFNESTHEIRGGALKETPLVMKNYAKDRTLAPGVTYVGSGVVVTISNRGHDPVLAPFAMITKAGEKPCKVPASKLWEEDDMLKALASGDPEAENFVTKPLYFKFPQDEAFDAFLKTTCGFGFL
ncbi:MAG: hypothetical protein H7222_07490 [Methylotenera sp.]|nr:hypothetical protein [Oligoflexia bacterium]